ncbi:MAG: T9SS type A sorting domain-containing protein [Ignavibacteriae bacterium]|nr:T9SS C-terminal target domain-containing protein [Ignavibacteriota bacterium]NOH00245.1 T9SS type A sorting domain-containing protein [Ignavibacteriota bacterium]
MRPLLTLLFFLHTAIYPQIVDKVLISGLTGYEQHDKNVKQAFEQGYSSYDGTIYEGEITLLAQSIYSSFVYARDSSYQMMIRSTTGLSAGIYYSNYFPTVKLIMPSGSNNFQLTYNGDIETCPVIVTGAGVSSNCTGYKIDFYSIDPITSENLSSYSNGFIAGQIAFIANYLECSIEDARILARERGTQSGEWDYYNGYGKVEVSTILESPFPVELSSFTAEYKNSKVILSWITQTEINNYGFEIQKAEFDNSEDNLIWRTIGFETGNGNSNKPIGYSFVDDKYISKGKYYYRLKQIDNDGQFEFSEKVLVQSDLPDEFTLLQNYPNPFNPETRIDFYLTEEEETELNIFDMLGNKVQCLIDENLTSGRHSVMLNAKNLAAGTYIYQLRAGNKTQTKKLVLLK